MPEAGAEPKKVPKRADAKPQGLIRNDGTTDYLGKDPNFVYHSFSQDPKSPGYIDRFTRPHFYGEGKPWGQWVGAWQVCNDLTDPGVHAVGTRTDAGHAVDTRTRGPGDQIVARIPVEEYAKYRETDRANNNERATQLGTPDVIRGGQHSTTTIVYDGVEKHPTQALIEAGHPMPGMR